MSEVTFLVKDRSGRDVLAKNLMDSNGVAIKNPHTGVAYIVPADYSVSDAIVYGHSLRDGDIGYSHILSELVNNFRAGRGQDLQRTYNGATNGDGSSFVEAFRDVASFHFGLVAQAAGISVDVAIMGGGLYNGIKDVLGADIDSSGDWWNNPLNPPNISKGSSFYLTNEHGIIRISPIEITANELVDIFNALTSSDPEIARWFINNLSGGQCFISGTMVEMADGTQKAIEEIAIGDMVASYSDDDPINGKLIGKKVTQLFRNEVEHILDVHGLKVTPGHVTLCGDGQFAGKHVPIIDILLSDGALVQADGQLVRMAINKPVGSVEDQFVKMAFALNGADAGAGKLQSGEIRVGTLLFDKDGVAISILGCLTAEGYIFDSETGFVNKPNTEPHRLNFFGALPRPEDYILSKSQETLEGILVANEWEGTASELIAGRLRHAMSMELN